MGETRLSSCSGDGRAQTGTSTLGSALCRTALRARGQAGFSLGRPSPSPSPARGLACRRCSVNTRGSAVNGPPEMDTGATGAPRPSLLPAGPAVYAPLGGGGGDADHHDGGVGQDLLQVLVVLALVQAVAQLLGARGRRGEARGSGSSGTSQAPALARPLPGLHAGCSPRLPPAPRLHCPQLSSVCPGLADPEMAPLPASTKTAGLTTPLPAGRSLPPLFSAPGLGAASAGVPASTCLSFPWWLSLKTRASEARGDPTPSTSPPHSHSFPERSGATGISGSLSPIPILPPAES